MRVGGLDILQIDPDRSGGSRHLTTDQLNQLLRGFRQFGIFRRAGLAQIFLDDGAAGFRIRRLFKRLDRDAGIAGLHKSFQRRVGVLDDAADDLLSGDGPGAERQAEGNRADRLHRSPLHPL